jgi:hypothetical protein
VLNPLVTLERSSVLEPGALSFPVRLIEDLWRDISIAYLTKWPLSCSSATAAGELAWPCDILECLVVSSFFPWRHISIR